MKIDLARVQVDLENLRPPQSVILSEGERKTSLTGKYRRAGVEGPCLHEPDRPLYGKDLMRKTGGVILKSWNRIRCGYRLEKSVGSLDYARTNLTEKQNFPPRSAQDDGLKITELCGGRR